MKLTINDVREYAGLYHLAIKSRELLNDYYKDNNVSDEQIVAVQKLVEQNQENEVSKLAEIAEALNGN